MKKIIHNRKVSLIALIALLLSCNPEYRLYKRVGGDHLHLQAKSKELFWFNGIHGYDPENPMFDEIKHEFQQFQPDVALVEGHANTVSHKDDLAARKSGENCYVSFLAQQKGIDCYDIEPSDSLTNSFLVDRYGKKDVLTMYLIRQMVQWNRLKENEIDFEKRVIAYVSREDRNIGYFDEEITLVQVSELLQPITHLERISNVNWRDFNAKEYIYFSENRIHTIYNDISTYRNEYLLFLINEKLKEYDRIFIMMGFDHAKEVEKELTEIFEGE